MIRLSHPLPCGLSLYALAACTASTPTPPPSPIASDTAASTAVDTDSPLDPDIPWTDAGHGAIEGQGGPCDEVLTALVDTPEARDAWFAALADTPPESPPSVDWPTQQLLVVGMRCANTGKTLSITDVTTTGTGIAAEVHLQHPSFDGSLLTTYWAAAGVPLDLDGPIDTTLTEATTPEQ